MTKLSDTQAIILSAAAQRDDRIALPLPANLKGGAATKVVDTMVAKGLLEEVEARRIAFQRRFRLGSADPDAVEKA